jgi:c-di-GMP-binding flagellar brake protein YcgR
MQSSTDNRYPSDRRRYPRVKAKIPVELLPIGTAAPMRTATDEISLCGCYVESMFTMDVGTKLQITFSLNEVKTSAVGIIATKYPQVGNGIDFVNMAPEDRLKLHAFISQLEQNPVSEC